MFPMAIGARRQTAPEGLVAAKTVRSAALLGAGPLLQVIRNDAGDQFPQWMMGAVEELNHKISQRARCVRYRLPDTSP